MESSTQRSRTTKIDRPVEEVGYASDVDVRTEFTRLLADIEAEMSSVLSERDGHARPLYEMLAYHLGLDGDAGPRGKRMRPLLGLLAYQSLTGDYRPALPGAAAVELGHNFSLVHDDIEDADTERRHRPTLWAIWGVPLAINAGDALFALSRLALYRLLGDFSERRVLALMRVYDETCLALCEGQYLDISFERRSDVSVDAYLEMIGKKTAALVGASVQAGAILATDDADVIEAYRRFGYDLGMAFQMADDVKGTFWGSSESGKPEAGDVRKRKKTLPVVWALENGSAEQRDRLTRLYADGIRATDGRGPTPQADAPMSDEAVSEVLEILERSGAREHALAEARRYRDLALADLDVLPCPTERKRDLAGLVRSVIAA
ncbi:MAG TPA: polyprenyl synthetase family protein [Candidatus Limnocylindrales bacterium]|jgi:geranylgeranyl diphosphate synthase, type I|nr:polyprenyl synthetase family protein [Candidatus Limnocylindrales bacterium]